MPNTITITSPPPAAYVDRCEHWEGCPMPAVTVRGELLMCSAHGKVTPDTLAGDVRCSCGYWRAPDTECGEPCL